MLLNGLLTSCIDDVIGPSSFQFLFVDEPDPIPALKQQVRDALFARIKPWADQDVAAYALGTDQPRMSDLKRNRLERFSLDTLIRWSARMDLQVELKIVCLRASAPRMFRFPPRKPYDRSSRKED